MSDEIQFHIEELEMKIEELRSENRQLTLLAEARRINANFYRMMRKQLDKRVTELWDENQKLKEENEPRLGCATTRQLLEELIARAEIDGSIGYRTVDS